MSTDMNPRMGTDKDSCRKREKIIVRRFVTEFILFLILFLFTVNTAWAYRFNIDPPKAHHIISPGEKKNGYVTVANKGFQKPIHVKVYIEDVINTVDGDIDFLPTGKTPWSCADWIKIRPTEFDIPPDGEVAVKYTVKVPQDAKGGGYAVIFFEVINPFGPKQVEGTVSNIGVRLGTIVLVTVKGTEEYKAKITDLSTQLLEDEEGAYYNISCTLQNLGNVLVRPKGVFQIIDAYGNGVSELDVNPKNAGLLPGTSRKYTARISTKLPPGRYEIKVLLDYAGETLLGGRASFEVAK